MSPRTHFLSLPRELRDAIYAHVVTYDGGLIYDHASRKLRTKQGPADLALVYTCKQIAEEMRGLALERNAIAFSTMCTDVDDLRIKAGCFDAVFNTLQEQKQDLAHSARHLLDPEARTHLSQLHSSLSSLFFSPADTRGWLPWESYTKGVAHSLRWSFAEHAIRLEAHAAALADITPGLNDEITTSVCHPLPVSWNIPAHHQIFEMEVIAASDEDLIDDIDDPSRINNSFSAAAVAIAFLSSLQSHTRMYLRNFILLEDRAGAAFPQSHGEGLILFA
ncbi:hypothetical protein BDV96DRAFT_649311 [Lophiotrema nucula]|uniref:Uncharacterized protein n=1 Tax=Lophiotrema nucula TaxID=690887 RepID=A0A6A5YYP1_9PLEO|nr:hypothetical protein BDV96DRAFT_649311 [Lophiotrema nucula]